MVSEELRNVIWNQQYDIIRLSQYYVGLSSFRLHFQMWSQIATVAASMGAIISVLEQVTFPSVVAGAVIAMSVVFSVTWNHPSRLAMIHVASIRCRELEIEIQELWQRLRWIDDREALEKSIEMSRKIEEATKPVQIAGVGYSSRRNDRAAEHAQGELEVLRGNFGAEGSSNVR